MSIASTIRQQIMALDFWALGAWGAKDMVNIGNGLRFKVNGTKMKHSFVEITLNASDLYDIRFYKIWGVKITRDEKVTDVFVENLVEVIDGKVG